MNLLMGNFLVRQTHSEKIMFARMHWNDSVASAPVTLAEWMILLYKKKNTIRKFHFSILNQQVLQLHAI